MASKILIKRSGSAGSPSTLRSGEMAYSYATGHQKLFIGWGAETTPGEADNIGVIGGVYFTSMLDHAAGTLTASSALIVDANKKLDHLLVDNLDLNLNTISTTNSNGSLVLDPNGTGSVDVSSSKIINVTDPTLGTDAATKSYVDTQVGAVVSDFTISDGSDSDSFSTGETLTFDGGTGITSTVTDNQVSLAITNTGVTANTYGSGSSYNIPVITVNAQGQITSAVDSTIQDASTSEKGVASFATADFGVTNGAVSIKSGGVSNTQLAGSVSNDKLANSSVTVGTTEIALGASSTVLAGLTQIDVDNVRIMDNTISTTDAGDTTLYINPNPVGDSGTVIIQGDLTVRGTTTTINSTEVTINDLTLGLADSADNAAAADGAGLIVGSGSFTGGTRPTFLYEASGDKWVANKTLDATILGMSETIDDRVSSLLLAGEAIDLTYDDGANSLTVAAEIATDTNLGVAKFPTANFTLTSGSVAISTIDGGTYS